jgi:putative DNA primase/helicase
VLEPFLIDSGEPFNNPNVIMFRNGLLDVRGNKLIPHTDNLFTTATLGYDYDPQAKCPLWIESVDQWFEGDTERIALLQEWFGYNLIMSNHLQQMMFMYGQSGSGKGTTVEILQHVLDSNFQAADTRQLCVDQFGIAPLEGKYAVMIAEEGKVTHDRGKKLMDILKRITGGDAMPSRHMRIIARNCKLFCRVTYYSNELPTFHDEMQTMLRRTNLLAFRKSFKDKPDRTLGTRLKEQRQGITAWAVAGLKRLLVNGDFTEPALSKREIEEIKIESSPLRQMLDEYLRFDDPNAFTSRKQLYDLYRAVCAEDHVDHPVSATYFPRRCREAMLELENKQFRLGNGGERGYRGVRMTEEGIFKCAG